LHAWFAFFFVALATGCDKEGRQHHAITRSVGLSAGSPPAQHNRGQGSDISDVKMVKSTRIQRCRRSPSVVIRSVALSLLAINNCNAFVAPHSNNAFTTTNLAATSFQEDAPAEQSRRSVVSLLTSNIVAVAGRSVLFPAAARAEAETMERGGVKLTPFNSLAFNYRGGESPTVDASTLNEPSVSYAEFLEKLNANQVTFVEFLAPNGDAAYATFKSEDSNNSKPIRIGEGYPIEDPEGWSSPAFVIKAVAKAGVPYKFVVPGLSDSFH